MQRSKWMPLQANTRCAGSIFMSLPFDIAWGFSGQIRQHYPFRHHTSALEKSQAFRHPIILPERFAGRVLGEWLAAELKEFHVADVSHWGSPSKRFSRCHSSVTKPSPSACFAASCTCERRTCPSPNQGLRGVPNVQRAESSPVYNPYQSIPTCC